MTFGVEHEADVSAAWQPDERGSALTIKHPRGSLPVQLALPGRHNVMNALAASAATLALGATPDAVRAGLESVRPVHGRLEESRGLHGARIIDDTYNANPASLRAALDVLSARPGLRILALGDMGELGNNAAQLHQEAGHAAKQLGIERLYATGELSRHAVDGFGHGGCHFADQQTLIEALRTALAYDVTVLVKGSRSRRMECVVEALSKEE